MRFRQSRVRRRHSRKRIQSRKRIHSRKRIRGGRITQRNIDLRKNAADKAAYAVKKSKRAVQVLDDFFKSDQMVERLEDSIKSLFKK